MPAKPTSLKAIERAVEHIEAKLFEGQTLRAIFRQKTCPVSRTVFYRAMAKDDGIRDRIKRARRWSLEEHAECLARGETQGNPTMTIFLLKGAAPEVYARPEAMISQTNVQVETRALKEQRARESDLEFIKVCNGDLPPRTEKDAAFIEKLNKVRNKMKPPGQDLIGGGA